MAKEKSAHLGIITPPGGRGETDEWETPTCLFNVFDQEFGFTVDAAATTKNSKCEHFFQDGLAASWKGETVWLNPPYSRVAVFMEKAAREARHSVIVALVPVRCDTIWWHSSVKGQSDELRLIEGRPYFTRGDGQVGPSPFPAGVVIYRPGSSRGLLDYVSKNGQPWKD